MGLCLIYFESEISYLLNMGVFVCFESFGSLFFYQLVFKVEISQYDRFKVSQLVGAYGFYQVLEVRYLIMQVVRKIFSCDFFFRVIYL